jgi:hypothetical protein
MKLIRALVFCIVLSVWSVVGLICWIPLLFRATASLAVGILYHAFTDTDASQLEIGFEQAVSFYPRGFKLIFQVLRHEGQSRGSSAKSPRDDAVFGRFLLELGWTAIFWIGTGFLLVRLFTPSPIFPSIAGSVDQVNFFSNDTTQRAEERLYQESFDSAAVRTVDMEVRFKHQPIHQYESFPISCKYVYPDGTETESWTQTYVPRADMTGGELLFGWGQKQPGGFPKGVYSAFCYLAGRRIVRRHFAVQ